MEIVVFIGIQATGKSEFYKYRFFDSHMHINLDMLKTRHRENLLMNACIEAKQSFVVDNTNPTFLDRKKYIDLAKTHKIKVIGFYFKSAIEESLARNEYRSRHVPVIAIKGTYAKLQLPTYSEGFDELYYVRMGNDRDFIVEEYINEI